jgi:hypothetical protein
MGVCALSVLPVVPITLDTRAPKATITADATVDPPKPWVVTISTDEEVAVASFVFEDGLGRTYSLGYDLVAPNVLLLEVPTTALPGGSGTLVGWLADACLNRTIVTRPVNVVRPQPFDVLLTIGHAVSVSESVNPAFDAALGVAHALDVIEGLDHAYEIELTVDHAFGVQETISHE